MLLLLLSTFYIESPIALSRKILIGLFSLYLPEETLTAQQEFGYFQNLSENGHIF